jgi:vancomycin resistance protein YoaR
VTDRPSFFATDEPDSDADSSEPRHATGRRDRRFLRWLVIGVALVLALLYVGGYAFASDRLPQGTTVAGVDVGGQRPDAAQRELRNSLKAPMSAPIELVVGDQQFSLDPAEVGLDVDVPASVEQVPVGRSWNPADMWESFVGDESYEPVVVTVDDLLTKRLEQIGEQVGEPPVEGAITFTADGPEATEGQAGTTLDVEAAADAIRETYPRKGASVELELEPAEPEITGAEVSRAMQRFANPAMSGSVTFTLDGEDITLEPGQYADALSMEPKGGELVPRVDREKLLALVEPAVSQTASSPVDATVQIKNGKPVVVPGRPGVTVREKRLATVFLDLAGTRGGAREAKLPTKVDKPDRTTQDVRQLGVKEKVSEFTTYYPHADYRNTNIGRAAEIVDGTLLEPGETFSLNDTVGERTRENGFTEGFIISDGVLKEDLGGGVSQMATTLFNGAFFAGLEDVEHKPHSFYIDRYPVGREATVAWPVVDLKFKNDTDHGVLINTIHQPSVPGGQGAITVQMWSTKVWDIESRTGERYDFTSPDTRYLSGDDCEPNEGYGGFTIDVTRVFREPGEDEIDHTEEFHTVYTPSDTVICE